MAPELPSGRRPRPTPPAAISPAPAPAPSPAPAVAGATFATGSDDAQADRVAAFFAARDDDDEDNGPGRLAGLATALHLDRLPLEGRWRTRGGIAAVVAGVGLFVAASIAIPLASADTASHKAAATPSPSSSLDSVVTPPPTSSLAPAVTKTLGAQPVHVAKPAPVTKTVISGLAANGIPKVALNAYRVAAARMANADPKCGIDWALLAGIGREESDHGQFAGAVLHANGVSTPPIVGPALDGIHWDYIPVSASYISITHDATYAHALGPMQFIPSTWAAYGADANGDHKADIFNINDAALGAARYLCAAGGNLRTHAGQVAAVLTYNHSDQYLAQVLALANDYRKGIPVSGAPVGITTGSLPKITDTGYIPPANPAAPTAVDPAAKKKSATSKAKASAAAKAKASAAAKAKASKSAGGGAATKPGGGGGGGQTSAAGGGAGGGATSKPAGGTSTPAGGSGGTTKAPSTPAPSSSSLPKCTLTLILQLKPCR